MRKRSFLFNILETTDDLLGFSQNDQTHRQSDAKNKQHLIYKRVIRGEWPDWFKVTGMLQ